MAIHITWQYVTKENSHLFVSESHPDLKDQPRIERAVSTVKAKGKARKGEGKHPSKQRYSTYDVVNVIQEAKIKTRLELIGLAVEQKKEGKTKLAEFIANIIYSCSFLPVTFFFFQVRLAKAMCR